MKSLIITEAVYGDTATVYHRCPNKDTPLFLYRKDWRFGSSVGLAYGNGLYACYEIKGPGAYNKEFYGHYIMKGYIKELNKFFIFNKEIYEKVYGKLPEDGDIIKAQNKKFGLNVSSTEVNDHNYWEFTNKYKINRRCAGIIFHGNSDGPVIITFDPYRFRPIKMAYVGSRKISDEKQIEWKTIPEFYKEFGAEKEDQELIDKYSKKGTDFKLSDEPIQDEGNPKNALRRSKEGLVYKEGDWELYNLPKRTNGIIDLLAPFCDREFLSEFRHVDTNRLIVNQKEEKAYLLNLESDEEDGPTFIDQDGKDPDYNDLIKIPVNILRKVNLPQYKMNLKDLLDKWKDLGFESYNELAKKLDKDLDNKVQDANEELKDLMHEKLWDRKNKKFTNAISLDKYFATNNTIYEKEVKGIKIYELKNFSPDIFEKKDFLLNRKNFSLGASKYEKANTFERFANKDNYTPNKRLNNNFEDESKSVDSAKLFAMLGIKSGKYDKYGYKKPAKMYEINGKKYIVYYSSSEKDIYVYGVNENRKEPFADSFDRGDFFTKEQHDIIQNDFVDQDKKKAREENAPKGIYDNKKIKDLVEKIYNRIGEYLCIDVKESIKAFPKYRITESDNDLYLHLNGYRDRLCCNEENYDISLSKHDSYLIEMDEKLIEKIKGALSSSNFKETLSKLLPKREKIEKIDEDDEKITIKTNLNKYEYEFGSQKFSFENDYKFKDEELVKDIIKLINLIIIYKKQEETIKQRKWEDDEYKKQNKKTETGNKASLLDVSLPEEEFNYFNY